MGSNLKFKVLVYQEAQKPELQGTKPTNSNRAYIALKIIIYIYEAGVSVVASFNICIDFHEIKLSRNSQE